MQALDKKIIIVTGSSRGLGRAIAQACADAGARVVLAGLEPERLGALQEDIRAAGGESFSMACDVSRPEDLKMLIAKTLQQFKRIDGLVNNAGVNFVKPFLEITESEWDRVLDVDLKGTFLLTQLCARQMVNQRPRGGSIVQIASVHTVASLEGAAPYDAAKCGVIGFSKAAAVELAEYGVRINSLSPGLCRTEIWNNIKAAAPSEEACLEYWHANIPGKRLIEPDEIAAACVFLLSDSSSAFTGANLMADLGMTSQLISRQPYP